MPAVRSRARAVRARPAHWRRASGLVGGWVPHERSVPRTCSACRRVVPRRRTIATRVSILKTRRHDA